MSDVPAKYKDLPRWAFGDSPHLADELLALVIEGKKTATCCSLKQYQDEKIPMPKPGDRAVILDGAQRPRCVLETVELEVKPFDHIDERFARDEGEGDLSYTYWRSAHVNYFTRQGVFSPDMLTVCERFRLVEVFETEETVR